MTDVASEPLTLTKDQLDALIASSVEKGIRAADKAVEEDRPSAPAAPATRSGPVFNRNTFAPPRLGNAMKAAYRGGWRSSEAFEKDVSQAASELFGYKGEKDGDDKDPIVETVGAATSYRSIIWPKSRQEMMEVLYAVGARRSADEVGQVDRAIRAMTEGTPADGGVLVPPLYAQDRFSYDLTSTIAVRNVPGIQWMPVQTNSVILPRESVPAGASQADEAGTLSAQDATLASQTIAIEKQYGFRRYSNELLADATPAWNEFLANTLSRDVTLQQDKQYLEGTGAAPQIQGLVGYSGVTAVSAGTNGASPDFDLFYDTQYALRLINAEADFVLAHPRVLNSLAKIKDASGNYILSNRTGVNAPGAFGTGLPGSAPKGVILDTIPMWFSSQMSIARTVGSSSDCTTVVMGQSGMVLGLDRQGIEIAFSEHLYFDTDETAARAIGRSAIAILQPDAVANITGIRG